MRRPAIIALCALALGSASGRAQSVVQHRETLASLGMPDGLGLVDPTQSHDIYYHGTDGVAAWDGKVHLDLTLAVHDFQYSFVQILVNDVPRWSQTVGATSTDVPVDLALSPTELDHAFLKITIRFGGRLTDDRCYDWRSNGSYITVRPTSRVQYTYRPEQVTTIDGAWSVLPRGVTVAIPAGTLTPAQFRAAWQVGSALMRAGHAVTFAQTTGAIETAGAYVTAPTDTSDGTGVVVVAPTPGEANLTLTHIDGRSVIVVGDTFPAGQFLGEDWRHVAQSDRMHVGESRSRRDVSVGAATVTFQQLGLGSTRQDLGDRADWSFPFSVRDLSPGFIPSNIALDVVAGLSPDKQASVAQVFVNDVLVRSTTVDQSGAAQRINVDLPRRLIGVDNTVRLEMQRKEANSLSPSTGECRALPATAPVQVLATSVITGTRIGDLTEFLELPAVFRSGFDVYLPATVLGNPVNTLPFLARLGADVLPMPDMASLTFFDSAHPPAPKRLFMMVGTTDGLAVDAPAKYEHGRLVVDDTKKRPVLDLSGSTRAAAVEIGSIGGTSGLLVLPLGNGVLPAPPSIALSRGDLAFVSAAGIDLIVDSRAATRGMSRLGAPFGRYRYWAYSVMALLLAGVIIYVLRRVRSQRS